jgi:hypothetical protein
MTAWMYDVSGVIVGALGTYFMFRGIRTLEAGGLVSGLVALLIGLSVFRSGLGLLKVGAASRVAAVGAVGKEGGGRRAG